MCGRYYIEEETSVEMKRIISGLQRKYTEAKKMRTGEVYPTNYAPILIMENKKIEPVCYKWGFPGFKKNSLIINARSESASEKKMFKESFLSRRCIIPANGFYEWSRTKEKKKYYFTSMDSNLLYMAGIYNQYELDNCFVILTTVANDSMKEIHNRIPVLLKPERIEEWLYGTELENQKVWNDETILSKKEISKKNKEIYEQLEFNFFDK